MNRNPYAPPNVASNDEPTGEAHACLVSIFCSVCGGTINIGDTHCAGCGKKVAKDEKQALQRRWEASDPETAKAAEESYWGRAAIGAAAALASLQAVIWLAAGSLPAWGMAGAVALWVLFGFSFFNAWAASALSFVVYLLWWFTPIVFAPLWLFDSILLKVIIVTALGTGFGAEASMRRRRRTVIAMLRAKRAKDNRPGL